MRFTRELSTPRSPEQVYDYLFEAERFGRLFPDCEQVVVNDPTRFTVAIGVGTGQFRGTLDFQMERPEAERPNRIRYTGSGQAAGNSITMDMAFNIAPNADGTHVTCECGAEVVGMFTFFAPDLADSLGRKKLDELIEALRAQLTLPE